MKNQNLNKESLDAIGLGVLRSCRLEQDELEKITAAPHLFDFITARIRAEESRQAAQPHSTFGFVPAKFMLRKAGFVFGGAAIAVLLGAAGWQLLANRAPASQAMQKRTAPAVSQVSSAPLIEPNNAADTSAIESPVPAIQTVASIERPAPRRAVNRKSREVVTRVSADRGDSEDMGEFYALASAGDTSQDNGGGQIVRVELPRSSLYAMGINVPVENETGKSKVKADLLIGPDGVMRAVRVVKF